MKNQKLSICAVIIILIGTLTPLSGQGVPMMKNLSGLYIDKWIHFGMFFTLGFLVTRNNNVKSMMILWMVFSVLLGVWTEMMQELIPGRGFEWLDIAADTLGALIGFLMATFYYAR